MYNTGARVNRAEVTRSKDLLVRKLKKPQKKVVANTDDSIRRSSVVLEERPANINISHFELETADDDEEEEHCCGCPEVIEAANRIKAKLNAFEELTSRFTANLVTLREAVKYLPVPPSPTVLSDAGDNIPEMPRPFVASELLGNTTIDLGTDDEDEEEEPIPAHLRRRSFQNTGEDDDAVQFIQEVVTLHGEKCSSPPQKKSRGQEHPAVNEKSPPTIAPVIEDNPELQFEIPQSRVVFQCKICTKSFPTELGLSEHTDAMHIIATVIDEPQQGPTAGFAQQGPSSGFACSVCSKKFTRKDTLTRHKKIHEKLPFDCTVCPRRFTTKPLLESHAKTHENAEIRSFICTVCSEGFLTEPLLESHAKTHENAENRPFICSVCSKGFKTKKDLSGHNKLHENAETRPFICDVCSKGFTTKSYLKVHKQTHENAETRPFICSVCSKGFTTKNNLKSHKKTHENAEIRPFICSVCSKGFKSKSYLKEHEELHKNAETRPFICAVCSKGFKTKKHLKDHTKIHENAETRPFVCSVCSKGFTTKSNLRSHEKIHKNASMKKNIPLSLD